jgi:5-methylcytosine-specific restriction endonuclease McrA
MYRNPTPEILIHRERNRRYRLKHHDEIYARGVKWRREHVIEMREFRRKWRAKNPEAMATARRNWSRRNPDKVLAYAIRYQAEVRAAGPWPSDKDIESKFNRYKTCPRCHRPWNIAGKKHVDHLTPPSRGGTNALENLQPLCKPCNSSKGKWFL